MDRSQAGISIAVLAAVLCALMATNGVAVASGQAPSQDSMTAAVGILDELLAPDSAETVASPFLPPGHGGTPPGQGGTPPGQTTPPGQGGTPPGQGGTSPGQGGGTPPGQGGGTPPGQG